MLLKLVTVYTVTGNGHHTFLELLVLILIYNLITMKRSIIAQIIIFLFVLLFAYTSTSKFLDYQLFVFQMRLAPLPGMIVVAPILGWVIPVIESLLVIGLLSTRYRVKSLYTSVVLLFLFETYITAMLLTGHHLPCTCGGIISTLSWKTHLLFNALYIALGIFAIRQFKHIEPHQLESVGI